jgi:serine/threonine protein kinase
MAELTEAELFEAELLEPEPLEQLQLIEPVSADALTPEIPSRRFGSWRLRHKLGEGGMAVVFLAESRGGPGQPVQAALKFMKPRVQEGVDFDALFAAEGDVMGMLRHPNLVEFYEVGKREGDYFLALEYCSGGDLSALMNAQRARGRPFPPPLALQIGIELLGALAAVHHAQNARGQSLGLVHGDLNPGNILLSPAQSRAKLADFGVVSGHALGPPEGSAAGKLHYLSPEQVQGKPLTAASDLFSLGVVLYEMLLGFRPFEGSTDSVVMDAICSARFDARPLSASERALFERALAKNPKNRFPTAGAFAGELLRHQLDSGLQAPPGALAKLMEELRQEGR